MKFIRSLNRTFIPFFILLVLIIGATTYFDILAEELSNEPVTVEVSISQVNRNTEGFWEFEDEIEDNDINESWRKDTIYINGKNFFDNKDWHKAENCFIALTNSYPNTPAIYNMLGLVQHKIKDYEHAKANFNKCLAIDSSYTGALLNLGILYVRLNRFGDAEKSYKRAIAQSTSNPKPYLNLGIMYCKNKKWGEAAKSLQQSVDLASGNIKSKILYYLGLSQLNLGDTLAAKNNFEESILLKPAYISPRIQMALTYSDVTKQIDELNKIISLNPDYAMAYYQLALINEQKGNLKKTEHYFKEAIQHDPRNEELQVSLAEYYLANDKTLEAEKIFDELKRKDAKLPQNYFNMAKIESSKGNFQTAITLYDSALAISENNYPEAHLNKGLLLRKLGKEQEAIKAYKTAIKFETTYTEAYYNLAIAYQKLKKRKTAVAYYRKALSIDPGFTKAWFNLGVIYRRKNNLDSAVYCYQKAVENDHRYLKAQLNLGIVLNRSNKSKQAIDCYKNAIKYYPNYSKLWFNLAIAYKDADNNLEAINCYEKVLSIEPNDNKARKNLGVLYSHMGNFEKAIQMYREAIEFDAADYELHYNLALQLLDNNNTNEAISELSKAIQLNSKYNKAYSKLFDVYIINEDIDNATRVLKDQLKYYPAADKAYELGKELYKLKKYNQALKWYDKSIALGNNDYWVYYWKGMLYADQNETTKAINQFNQSLQLNPKAKFTHLRIGELLESQNSLAEAKIHYQKVYELDSEFAKSKNILNKINTNN